MLYARSSKVHADVQSNTHALLFRFNYAQISCQQLSIAYTRAHNL